LVIAGDNEALPPGFVVLVGRPERTPEVRPDVGTDVEPSRRPIRIRALDGPMACPLALVEKNGSQEFVGWNPK
jgi:hypothetical protein